jgi:hypothetical protein
LRLLSFFVFFLFFIDNLCLFSQIIGGHNLPKPVVKAKKKGGSTGITGGVVSPYLELRTFGVPEDTKTWRTGKVSENGFNPTWNQTFEIPFLMSEVAVLMFTVYTDEAVGRSRLAYTSFPVEMMRSGYRVVELYDASGWSKKLMLCSLLVRVTIN